MYAVAFFVTVDKGGGIVLEEEFYETDLVVKDAEVHHAVTEVGLDREFCIGVWDYVEAVGVIYSRQHFRQFLLRYLLRLLKLNLNLLTPFLLTSFLSFPFLLFTFFIPINNQYLFLDWLLISIFFVTILPIPFLLLVIIFLFFLFFLFFLIKLLLSSP